MFANVVLFAFLLAAGPTFAQASTLSTGTDATVTPTVAKPLAARIRRAPAKPSQSSLAEDVRRRDQAWMKENKTLTPEGQKIQTLDQIKILSPALNRFDVKSLIRNRQKSGGVDSGGGDSIGLEFQLALGDAAADFVQYSAGPKPDFDWFEINRYGVTLHVIALDQILMNDAQPVIALNDVATKTIRVNRSMWNAVNDVRVKNAIALNMTLAMRAQMSFAIAQIPGAMLLAAGLSPNDLVDGKVHPLGENERKAYVTVQCRYGFEEMKRSANLWQVDVMLCMEKKYPGLVKLRGDRIENAVARCMLNCAERAELKSFYDACVANARVYSEALEIFRRRSPKCVN